MPTTQPTTKFESLISLGAPIITTQDLHKNRSTLGRLVATGGGYDPIHPGHISCLVEGKKLGDTLAVIVNGDWFLKQKKGKPFQDLATRAMIVSALKCVDYVIPYETTEEMGVFEVVKAIKADVYVKGGDRMPENIRDFQRYQELGVDVVTNIGSDKKWSSSWFLDDWVRHATH
jgi:cytidyltransferase-like protein